MSLDCTTTDYHSSPCSASPLQQIRTAIPECWQADADELLRFLMNRIYWKFNLNNGFDFI